MTLCNVTDKKYFEIFMGKFSVCFIIQNGWVSIEASYTWSYYPVSIQIHESQVVLHFLSFHVSGSNVVVEVSVFAS